MCSRPGGARAGRGSGIWNAVEDAFGCEIDYAMLVKIYGAPERRDALQPRRLHRQRVEADRGDPTRSTSPRSYVERQNLTMRMSMRRFTRLTNGFSKKVENHAAAVALHFMYYNFGGSTRRTPAMEAGVANHVWSVEEVVGLLG